MKKIFNRRNIINFFCLLVIVTAIFFGYRTSTGRPITSGSNSSSNSSQYPADFPTLHSLKKAEGTGNVFIGPYSKQFAFEIDKSATYKTITFDVLEIYRWGRSQYGDISSKCYTDPDSSCKVGNVAIFLMIPNTKNDKYDYDLFAVFYLDQDAIDQLLFMADKGEMTPDGLDSFHKNLYQTDNVGFLPKPTAWVTDLPIYLP